ncbi:NACHT, LRR and PYD domains-containing protein 8 [Octodon degus]|uniref:NACHT, LRR and PYD domains-containing protein 8 n=1 Tax=Octodon degus TaxID=10160 RepID=A0A6P3V9K1_OCTDE|nr:NACHT, LRR and PYD domains-containing protein 8 [Octodon degus]
MSQTTVRPSASPWENGLMLYMASLSQEELQGFKWLLVEEQLGPSPRAVTWDLLAKASWAEVVHFLVERCPGRRAWDVAHSIFTRMNKEKMCVQVQEELTGPEGGNPRETPETVEWNESDQIRAYKQRVAEKYYQVWDRRVWPGSQEDFLYREARQHQAFLPCLFLPRRVECAPPKTVILWGVPSIGKTTLVKQVMLAWARDTFYPHKAWLAFYLHCREVMEEWRQSCWGLIGRQLYGSPAFIFKRPEQLLLIFDGFEELEPKVLPGLEELSQDLEQQLSGSILLSSLLSGTMLAGASRLVAIRPASWCTLSHLFTQPSIVNLPGFDRTEIIEYFRMYFGNTRQGNEALNFMAENAALGSLCRVPVVCWAVCCSLRQRRGLWAEACPNVTSVLVLFLSTLLRGSPSLRAGGSLESLCLLAARGMWDQKCRFNKEDLSRARLDEASVATFLDTNVLRKVVGRRKVSYLFTLFIFQELLAALLYLLLFPHRLKRYHVLGSINIWALLAGPADDWCYQAHMGFFLFGLLNSACATVVECNVQHKLTTENRAKVIKVINAMYENQSLRLDRATPQLFHCLPELKGEIFMSLALTGLSKVVLRLDGDRDLQAAAFCFPHCRELKHVELIISKALREALQPGPGDSLPLAGTLERDRHCRWWGDVLSILNSNGDLQAVVMTDVALASPFVKQLATVLKRPQCRLSSLSLRRVGQTTLHADLFCVVAEKPHLRSLEVQQAKVGYQAMRQLRAALRSPECCVQVLRLESCGLTEQCCPHLALCLRSRPQLTHLSLAGNALGDAGAMHIWTVLASPESRLRRLVLRRCSLTAACCRYIAPVLKSRGALRSLDLSFNNLTNNGMLFLSRTLAHSGFALQVLELESCSFTKVACRAMVPMLNASQHLEYLDVSGNDVGPLGQASLSYIHLRVAALLHVRKEGGRQDALARLAGPTTQPGHLKIVRDQIP